MPQAYATLHGESFAKEIIRELIASSCSMEVTNQDYEGQLTKVGDIVHIPSVQVGEWQQISDTPFVSWGNLYEQPSTMQADQIYGLNFRIGDLDRLRAWIKNPSGTAMDDAALKLKALIDKDIFSLYTDAAAGNWIGTNYTTGTVAVAATTGVVTGTGTTFTSDMVGKPFKATGHTKWYRVKAYTSATSITIEDDLDDVASAYTGGAIAAGASYQIQANTPITVTPDGASGSMSVWDMLTAVKNVFDENNVPETERRIVLPPKISNMLSNSAQIDRARLSVDVMDKLKIKGYVGEWLGLKIYMSNNLTKDASGNYHALAAHKSWCTFAWAINESEVCRIEMDYGAYGYKALAVWGRKVPDVRRMAGVHIYATA